MGGTESKKEEILPDLWQKWALEAKSGLRPQKITLESDRDSFDDDDSGAKYIPPGRMKEAHETVENLKEDYERFEYQSENIEQTYSKADVSHSDAKSNYKSEKESDASFKIVNELKAMNDLKKDIRSLADKYRKQQAPDVDDFDKRLDSALTLIRKKVNQRKKKFFFFDESPGPLADKPEIYRFTTGVWTTPYTFEELNRSFYDKEWFLYQTFATFLHRALRFMPYHWGLQLPGEQITYKGSFVYFSDDEEKLEKSEKYKVARKQFEDHELIRFSGFTSSSLSPAVAIDFCKHWKDDGKLPVLYKFQTFNGRYIDQYSAFSESEILIPPYSLFQVRKSTMQESGILEVRMKQVQYWRGRRFVLWVDDSPRNNKRIVELAEGNAGTNVALLVSTTEALDFVHFPGNKELIYQGLDRVRIITDMSREELHYLPPEIRVKQDWKFEPHQHNWDTVDSDDESASSIHSRQGRIDKQQAKFEENDSSRKASEDSKASEAIQSQSILKEDQPRDQIQCTICNTDVDMNYIFEGNLRIKMGALDWEHRYIVVTAKRKLYVYEDDRISIVYIIDLIDSTQKELKDEGPDPQPYCIQIITKDETIYLIAAPKIDHLHSLMNSIDRALNTKKDIPYCFLRDLDVEVQKQTYVDDEKEEKELFERYQYTNQRKIYNNAGAYFIKKLRDLGYHQPVMVYSGSSTHAKETLENFSHDLGNVIFSQENTSPYNFCCFLDLECCTDDYVDPSD